MASPRRTTHNRVTKALEWPMAILALLLIPALLLDDGASTPTTHLVATVVNWIVWLAFCGEYVLRLAVAPERVRVQAGIIRPLRGSL